VKEPRVIATADYLVVKALCDRLVKAFEQFASETFEKDPDGRGIDYIDAFMGCHNFYKTVILDLERRVGKKYHLREVALATLAEALK
jgi:hypothetical protein